MASPVAHIAADTFMLPGLNVPLRAVPERSALKRIALVQGDPISGDIARAALTDGRN